MSMWLFGYGSLIWRPDIKFLAREPARLQGWVRRFWQGSHDHRGLPHSPGRVVTLVESTHGHCDGVAYLVDATLSKKLSKPWIIGKRTATCASSVVARTC